MNVFIYCALIVIASLAGGWLPLARRLGHLRLQVYLSLSAGAMLGAAAFHMLPEAAELAGHRFGLWMAVGVLGLYMIERFLSPHSHETPAHDVRHGMPDSDETHAEAETTDRGHARCAHHGSELTSAAAPRIAGWSAVAGLSIHTLLGGVALGGAVLGPQSPVHLGFAVFLATVLHKPADSLTISTLLIKAQMSRRVAIMTQCLFAALIPLGVLLFQIGRSTLAGQLDTEFTGCVLAFSSGTFLCIALSDLLPEVQFHSHDRLKLFSAVLFGAAVMWATAAVAHPAHSPDARESGGALHEPLSPH